MTFSDNQPQSEISFQAVKNTDPVLIYDTTVSSTFTIAKIFKSNAGNRKTQWGTETLNQVTLAGKARLKISKVIPSPDKKFIAIEAYSDIYPTTWMINLHTGRLSLVLKNSFSHLLGWHPDNKHLILKVEDAYVADPGLWFLDVHTKEHTRIDIPDLPYEGLLDVAVSPDGNQIAYAYSRGMGFGSELWMMDLSNNATRQVHVDAYGVVGYIIWSPNGEQVAFTEMLDSPIPFQQGGLWIVNADGSNLKLLSTSIDGGHGQEPVFSADGKKLYFVERGNPQDNNANYEPDALISSIQSVELSTGRVTELVSANGSKQLDISLSSDGSIFFVSNRGGGASEVWVLDSDGILQQITTDGQNKNHPLIVSVNN